MEDIQIRMMKLEDLDQVLEVEQATFTSPWSKEAFLNELLNNHFAHYVVAEYGEKIVGYCGVWLIMDEAHITNVAVHPRQQGKKIGYRLMKQIMELSKQGGARRITLEVRVSNHVAQSLYKKLGFVGHGIRKRYYQDNQEDALIMWATLPDELNQDQAER